MASPGAAAEELLFSCQVFLNKQVCLLFFDRDIFTLQTLSGASRAYHFQMRKSKYMLLVNNQECFVFCFYAATMYVVVSVPFWTRLHFRDTEAEHVVIPGIVIPQLGTVRFLSRHKHRASRILASLDAYTFQCKRQHQRLFRGVCCMVCGTEFN